MEIKQYTLDELSLLLSPIFKRNKVTKAAVFGSYARGEQTENSDYDFLVDMEKDAGLEFYCIYDELKDVLNKDVDIITYWSLNRKPEMFIKSVTEEAKIIYES